jgi:putative endonuclease
VISAKRADGDAFEDRALAFLEARGLTLVTRNWSCRGGEIDLVMREGAALVFVEVRKRSSKRFGNALQSVVGGKTERVRFAMNAYLARLPAQPASRIDVVSFDGGDAPEWTKNVVDW